MFFFFKQKTTYEMRISYWSSDVCSSDLGGHRSRRIEDGGGQPALRPRSRPRRTEYPEGRRRKFLIPNRLHFRANPPKRPASDCVGWRQGLPGRHQTDFKGYQKAQEEDTERCEETHQIDRKSDAEGKNV